jgi:hypothetical protein
VYQDLFWAKALVMIMGVIVGIPSTLVTYRVKQQTSVNTPWKPALALTAILIIAFVFSLF